jgi:hypothetical protein
MSDRTPLERDIDISRKYGKLTLYQIVERVEKAEAEISSLESRLQQAQEWRDSVSGAIKQIPEFHSGKWCGDKEGWGFHFEVVRWLQRERESSESRLQVAQGELAHELNANKAYIANLELLNVRLRAVTEATLQFCRAISMQDEEEPMMDARRQLEALLAPPTEPTEAARPLPTIDEMCGLIPDLTEGRTLKEYMKDLDDDE